MERRKRSRSRTTSRAIWLWLAVGFGVLCIPWALADGNPFMAAVFFVGVLYGAFRLWSRKREGAT